MKILRYLLIFLGIVTFAVGLAAGLSGGTPLAAIIGNAIEVLGNDYLLVAVIAGVAILITLIAGGVRMVRGNVQYDPPDPEGIPSAPYAGYEFDELTDGGMQLRRWLFSDDYETLHDRLRETAIQTIINRSNCSYEEAERRVEQGSWTADAEAASFLGGENVPPPPAAGRVRAALRGQRWQQRGARRTVEAIAQYTGSGS